MAQYKSKNEADHVYDESRKRVRFELNLLLARAADAALAEMTSEFNDALSSGGLSAFCPSREDALRYLRTAAIAQLGVGDAAAE